MLSTTEASVVKESLALGETGTADGTGVRKMPGRSGGRVAVGNAGGITVEVGMGVQLGVLVGPGVKVAVGSIRLGTSMTTGVGVVASAIAEGVRRLDR